MITKLIFVALIFAFIGLNVGQFKRFEAKWTDCGGSADVRALLNKTTIKQVTITAPYNRNAKRHILITGRNVEICINGPITNNIQPYLPIRGIKNSAHGKLSIIGVVVPVPLDFCDIQRDGCQRAKPSCPDISVGDEAQFCSTITVPPAPGDPDVEVTWKVLMEKDSEPDQCERVYGLGDLKKKGKRALACINIPTKVQGEIKRRRKPSK